MSAALVQTPIAAVVDHACPNCGSTNHRERAVDPRRSPLPWACAQEVSRRIIERLGGRR